ncbi:hypothetical protein BDN70DRAFT_817287 [Pholiota conissans]|uniref:DUF6535 domain-containing protein n=1 Tax=Pholiota conissans TaxID=109636 RepID=A0A9P5YP81_9AGAR|nr:hypothetical protein BDN70DRAFT_817287 [Pholiota conissans]
MFDVSASGFIESASNLIGLFSETSQELWDELGSEGAEHARIWHIYNDETAKMDAATIDGLNRGIDVLLVFTGLFSAVLTTFIIQSYQQMLPSPSDSTNLLLEQLIMDLRRSSILNINEPILLPTVIGEHLVPTTREIHWVNGLWFAALACSLSAALVSMLAKQWIQPAPNVSGSPQFRARKRQWRYAQLKRWHVHGVINALPLLLHAALLLFFAGIIVLLWSGDIAIMTATFCIVALAYTFYLGSMWMSLIYPDCPYQHPISEHMRLLIYSKASSKSNLDLQAKTDEALHYTRRHPTPSTIVDPNHLTDASALVWILQNCSNKDTIAAALQAIGGLSKDFTAFHILRDAGALTLILRHFSTCFHRDMSVDLRWHVTEAEFAERYCRAWVRLTHGTSILWPRSLQDPLQVLSRCDNIHASAIATCTIALNSLESRTSQLEMIYHLKAFVDGETTLSDLTQRWLLDTFLECSMNWELHAAVVRDITRKSVPVLLRLLQRTTDGTFTTHCHATIPLILQILTTVDSDGLMAWNEENRAHAFRQTMILVFHAIIQNPGYYGVSNEILDLVIIQFAQLAAPIFMLIKFPKVVKEAARRGLSKLYLEGRIAHGLVPDSVLADILQVLHPPVMVSQAQKPWFVKILVNTLAISADRNVEIGCIRLIESILRDCQSDVIRAFTESNGIANLIQLSNANAGHIAIRRLQLDCIRTLCVFIQSSTKCYVKQEELCPSHSPSLEKQFDEIFASDFFKTLLATVGVRRWWLAEIADCWLPSLLLLCAVKPKEQVWKRVEVVFKNFAENNVGEEGSKRMVNDLKTLRSLLEGV